MNKCFVAMLILLFSVMINACGSSTKNNENNTDENHTDIAMQLPSKDIIKLKGKIEYKHFEGGFYAFIDSKGSKYTPINLDKSFKKDGLKVHIVAQRNLDIYTTTQFGEAIKIIQIDLIDSDDERINTTKDR